jgi:acyl-coenzyme A thioesterase PaaI-like protein
MNDEPDQAVSGPENRCFGCSPTNPIGLQLSFRTSGEQVEADFIGRDDHCGVPGVVHGGIVMTAIDEAMGYVIHSVADSISVTKSASTDFRRPVWVGAAHRVRARIDRIEGADVFASGEVVDANGKICARGRAHFVTLSPERVKKAFGDRAAAAVRTVQAARPARS